MGAGCRRRLDRHGLPGILTKMRWIAIIAAIMIGGTIMAIIPQESKSLCFGHVVVIAGNC